MRRLIASVSTALALTLGAVAVAPALAADNKGSTVKKKCDQSALAAYVAYHQARKAILAAYKTVVNAAKVTYQAALESGNPSVRKAAKANYDAAVLAAQSTRDSALSALGSPPPLPPNCKVSSDKT